MVTEEEYYIASLQDENDRTECLRQKYILNQRCDTYGDYTILQATAPMLNNKIKILQYRQVIHTAL